MGFGFKAPKNWKVKEFLFPWLINSALAKPFLGILETTYGARSPCRPSHRRPTPMSAADWMSYPLQDHSWFEHLLPMVDLHVGAFLHCEANTLALDSQWSLNQLPDNWLACEVRSSLNLAESSMIKQIIVCEILFTSLDVLLPAFVQRFGRYIWGQLARDVGYSVWSLICRQIRHGFLWADGSVSRSALGCNDSSVREAAASTANSVVMMQETSPDPLHMHPAKLRAWMGCRMYGRMDDSSLLWKRPYRIPSSIWEVSFPKSTTNVTLFKRPQAATNFQLEGWKAFKPSWNHH